MSDSDLPEDLLVNLLRSTIEQTDPLPDGLRDAATNILHWRADDADLATMGVIEPVAVRGGASASAEVLVFQVGELEIEIALGNGYLDGSIDPWSGDADVSVETAAGESTALSVDEYGDFRFESPSRRNVRIRVVSAEQQFRSEWFLTRSGSS